MLNNKLASEQNILAFSKYGCDNGVWSLNVQFIREDDDEPVDGMRSSLNMGVVSSHLQLLDGCCFLLYPLVTKCGNGKSLISTGSMLEHVPMTRSCAKSWCAYGERPTWAAHMTLTY